MIAYLDLPAGISGDMFLGCLVDAGWPIEELRAVISRLNLQGDAVTVDAQRVMRGPLSATLVRVDAPDSHHHRHLHHVTGIIQNADLPPTVKERAVAVFTRLAHAEAKIHGTTVEKIHFHEVGALDAIVDIVGTVAGLEALGIERLYASGVPLGEGWTNSAHGALPLPAPATLEILSAAGAPNRPAPGPGELVTPTGAALLAELATFTQPSMTLLRIGTGAGGRQCAWPNVARLWLGQAADAAAHVQMETNIDDMNPQLYAGVCESLFAAGALDVWLTPVQMKKNRPGVVLSVIAPASRETELAAAILRETTTLGMRVTPVRRHEARREMRSLSTPWGTVNVKLKYLDNRIVGALPEYEDCRRLAQTATVRVRIVYEAALAEAHRQFLSPS